MNVRQAPAVKAQASGQQRSALGGVVVADFSRLVAGPYATLLLADLGADVIKIENPGTGDDSRALQPPTIGGESAFFLWANRNKQSIALDLRSIAGRQVALDIIARSDVLVENFSAGVMDRLGLGWETVSKLNPRLIYAAVSAFGREGSLATRPGYDPIVQAESGFSSLNGFPEHGPVRAGSPIIDISTAMMLCNAILAGLLARERTGTGQYVETSLFADAITMTGQLGYNCLVTGLDPVRAGNDSNTAEPVGVFECADGPVSVACVNDRNFTRLAREVLVAPDLLETDSFTTNALRLKNRVALRSRLIPLFQQLSQEVVLDRARAAAVPMGMVRTMGEALASPEIVQMGLLSEIHHPVAGPIPNIAAPLCLHGTPLVDPVPAPTLGQHRDDILAGLLGYRDHAIRDLEAAGAFGAPALARPADAAV